LALELAAQIGAFFDLGVKARELVGGLGACGAAVSSKVSYLVPIGCDAINETEHERAIFVTRCLPG